MISYVMTGKTSKTYDHRDSKEKIKALGCFRTQEITGTHKLRGRSNLGERASQKFRNIFPDLKCPNMADFFANFPILGGGGCLQP